MNVHSKTHRCEGGLHACSLAYPAILGYKITWNGEGPSFIYVADVLPFSGRRWSPRTEEDIVTPLRKENNIARLSRPQRVIPWGKSKLA